MFNRRFIPYLITICMFVFLFASYIGFKAYQKQVEFKEFMSEAKMFQWSLDQAAPPQQYEYTGNFTLDELTPQEVIGPDGKTYRTIVPPGIDVETLQTRGYVIEFSNDDMVTQLVETPDGEIHEIIVPRGFEIQEGEAVSRNALDRPLVDTRNIMSINGVEYEIPEGVDPVEYGHKLRYVHDGLSMEEVEKKIEAGEINIHISDEERRSAEEAERLRTEWLQSIPNKKPPMSDKPPVKVRFLTHEEMRDDFAHSTSGGEQGLVEAHRHPHDEELEPLHGGEYLEIGTVPERGINENANGASVRSNVPRSPSDLSSVVESTPSPSNMANLEKQLTPEGIKAELSKGVSPERFNKAQQLINRYGSEEGLRRLRESDLEAARQFERLATPKGQSPEQEQREQKTNTEP